MRLLVFSDIHGDVTALERLLAIDADFYVAAGDLVNWGRGLDRMGELLGRRNPRVYVLPGNHESEQAIARMCERYGLNAFHERSFEADGYHIAGLGYSNPTPFDTPGEYSEAELAAKLAPFSGLQPLILICHCPPKDTTLDDAGHGKHFGSSSVREFIERHSRLTSFAATFTKRRAFASRWDDARMECRQEGVFVRIGST